MFVKVLRRPPKVIGDGIGLGKHCRIDLLQNVSVSRFGLDQKRMVDMAGAKGPGRGSFADAKSSQDGIKRKRGDGHG